MGSVFQLRLVHKCGRGPEPTLFLKIQERLKGIESAFSLYQEGSELSKFNREGHLRSASDEMIRLVRLSQEIFALSHGLFDPSMGLVVKTLKAQGPANLELLRPYLGFSKVKVQGSSLQMSKGMELTFDGIAKGFALDEAMKMIPLVFSGALLNFSGNILTRGLNQKSRPWSLTLSAHGVNSPFSVPLEGEALSTTSSQPEVFFKEKKFLWHHIINPRSLKPEQKYQAVSVRGPGGGMVDALSTAFFSAPEGEIASILKNNLAHYSVFVLIAGDWKSIEAK